MTASLLGEIRPAVHRFALGDAEVITIMDGAQVRDAIQPPFALDKSAEELAEIAASNFLPADRFENSFTPTVINTGSELVLFDVGFGAMGRENGTGNLRARLAEAGYAPEDIDVVAFTHMHPDHIAGVMEGDGLAFPNARHVMGRREFDEWNSGDRIPEPRKPNRDMFLKLIAPLAEQLTFLEGGDTVAKGIEAEEAFGHSLGHLMYRVESAGKSILVWGDITNHYVFSLKYPDSPVGFDDNKEQGIATRKRVLDMVATDRLLVAGHHMPFPSVGYVERDGNSYRWTPASYQIRL